MFVFLDLIGVSSSGILRQPIQLDVSCLEIAGSNEIWLHTFFFFRPFGFKREQREALLYVVIMGNILFVSW
jgi:hypothetical protein